MTILEKVQIMLDGEDYDVNKIQEYINLVVSRLVIRLGVTELPLIFYPIASEATVKVHRRYLYEGISSEGDSGLTTSFVEDVLNEYTNEIESYSSSVNKVRFI